MMSTLTAGTAAVPPSLLRFGDASADLIAARQLQKRLDRKYLFATAMLDPILAALAPDFRVVRAADHLVATYDSLYFDTAERRMYEDHRRGASARCDSATLLFQDAGSHVARRSGAK